MWFLLFFKFTHLINDTVWDTSQEPDGEKHRARNQIKQLPSSRSLGPGSVTHGSILVPQIWKFSLTEKQMSVRETEREKREGEQEPHMTSLEQSLFWVGFLGIKLSTAEDGCMESPHKLNSPEITISCYNNHANLSLFLSRWNQRSFWVCVCVCVCVYSQ